MEISFTLNGKETTCEVPTKYTLLKLLRDDLKLTGTKVGCDTGDCGACSVIIDGQLKKACTFPVKKLAGKDVVTIEGIANPDGSPNDLQQAFLEQGATQCGYCTPGMVLAGEAVLLQNPDPTRMEIRAAIAENLCRCTGYQQIVDAVEVTAKKRLNKGDAS